MDRRSFIAGSGRLVLGGAISASAAAPGFLAPANGAPAEGELLYNGIRLPAEWPPHLAAVPTDPVDPPYLLNPPAVIPIDLGRQLFVDDFLIRNTTLTRTLHAAEYHPASPVVRPDRPWEMTGTSPTAMVFSDGVWYDPADHLFKMWYMGGSGVSTCYATSTDGIHWEKPVLDVKPGTNIVLAQPRDSSTVWLDQQEQDPARRYKLFRCYSLGDHWGLQIHFSHDGVHWSDVMVKTGSCGDRSTAFWNPYRKVWVFSLRHGWGRPRRRRYWEVKDLLKGPLWTGITEPTIWAGADRLDPIREDLKTPPELYNLDAVAYESLMIGLFSIWRGQPTDRPKPNEVCIGFSRDGFNWSRPSHAAFIPVSEHKGDWNWGNVQSAGGGCLVVGDKLYFYCSGRAGVPGTSDSGVSSTGLAILRRDGFASLDAGAAGGELVTRLVQFTGKRLFVNLDAPHGELRAEVLDEQGAPLKPFTLANCIPVKGDNTRAEVRWKAVEDPGAAAGRPVRFRFVVKSGKFYSFWISQDHSGASGGYVGAGGPGLPGPRDNKG